MANAYVIGAAMLPMRRYVHASYAGLGAPPVLAALKSARADRRHIDAVYCGHAFGGMLTGQRVVKELGLGGVPVFNLENACSGGASAFQAGVHAIAEGRAQAVLVIGVDKLSQFGGGALPLVAEDPEVSQGVIMPAVYAMRARRYIHERDARPADLAAVVVKARRHAALNPFAQIRATATAEEILASRMIADPLTLFQCCPTGDGAAAVVLVSAAVKRRLGAPGLAVRASIMHSGQVLSGFRDMLKPEISTRSAAEAYAQAEIEPSDLDLIELHDAFSIAELIYYEALGLCRPGDGLALLRDGRTALGGDLVVNPSGGLLTKGHPVGASGVAQIVEAFWQLTDRAGARQVAGARLAMTHVTGGGVAGLDHGACTVHIFERAA